MRSITTWRPPYQPLEDATQAPTDNNNNNNNNAYINNPSVPLYPTVNSPVIPITTTTTPQWTVTQQKTTTTTTTRPSPVPSLLHSIPGRVPPTPRPQLVSPTPAPAVIQHSVQQELVRDSPKVPPYTNTPDSDTEVNAIVEPSAASRPTPAPTVTSNQNNLQDQESLIIDYLNKMSGIYSIKMKDDTTNNAEGTVPLSTTTETSLLQEIGTVWVSTRGTTRPPAVAPHTHDSTPSATGVASAGVPGAQHLTGGDNTRTDNNTKDNSQSIGDPGTDILKQYVDYNLYETDLSEYYALYGNYGDDYYYDYVNVHPHENATTFPTNFTDLEVITWPYTIFPTHKPTSPSTEEPSEPLSSSATELVNHNNIFYSNDRPQEAPHSTGSNPLLHTGITSTAAPPFPLLSSILSTPSPSPPSSTFVLLGAPETQGPPRSIPAQLVGNLSSPLSDYEYYSSVNATPSGFVDYYGEDYGESLPWGQIEDYYYFYQYYTGDRDDNNNEAGSAQNEDNILPAWYDPSSTTTTTTTTTPTTTTTRPTTPPSPLKYTSTTATTPTTTAATQSTSQHTTTTTTTSISFNPAITEYETPTEVPIYNKVTHGLPSSATPSFPHHSNTPPQYLPGFDIFNHLGGPTLRPQNVPPPTGIYPGHTNNNINSEAVISLASQVFGFLDTAYLSNPPPRITTTTRRPPVIYSPIVGTAGVLGRPVSQGNLNKVPGSQVNTFLDVNPLRLGSFKSKSVQRGTNSLARQAHTANLANYGEIFNSAEVSNTNFHLNEQTSISSTPTLSRIHPYHQSPFNVTSTNLSMSTDDKTPADQSQFQPNGSHHLVKFDQNQRHNNRFMSRLGIPYGTSTFHDTGTTTAAPQQPPQPQPQHHHPHLSNPGGNVLTGHDNNNNNNNYYYYNHLPHPHTSGGLLNNTQGRDQQHLTAHQHHHQDYHDTQHNQNFHDSKHTQDFHDSIHHQQQQQQQQHQHQDYTITHQQQEFHNNNNNHNNFSSNPNQTHHNTIHHHQHQQQQHQDNTITHQQQEFHNNNNHNDNNFSSNPNQTHYNSIHHQQQQQHHQDNTITHQQEEFHNNNHNNHFSSNPNQTHHNSIHHQQQHQHQQANHDHNHNNHFSINPNQTHHDNSIHHQQQHQQHQANHDHNNSSEHQSLLDEGSHQHVLVKVWSMIEGKLEQVGEHLVPHDMFTNSSLANGDMVNPQDMPREVLAEMSSKFHSDSVDLEPWLRTGSSKHVSTSLQPHHHRDTRDTNLQDTSLPQNSEKGELSNIAMNLNTGDELQNTQKDLKDINPGHEFLHDDQDSVTPPVLELHNTESSVNTTTDQGQMKVKDPLSHRAELQQTFNNTNISPTYKHDLHNKNSSESQQTIFPKDEYSGSHKVSNVDRSGKTLIAYNPTEKDGLNDVPVVHLILPQFPNSTTTFHGPSNTNVETKKNQGCQNLSSHQHTQHTPKTTTTTTVMASSTHHHTTTVNPTSRHLFRQHSLGHQDTTSSPPIHLQTTTIPQHQGQQIYSPDTLLKNDSSGYPQYDAVGTHTNTTQVNNSQINNNTTSYFGGVGNPTYNNMPLSLGTSLQETDLSYINILSNFVNYLKNSASQNPTLQDAYTVLSQAGIGSQLQLAGGSEGRKPSPSVTENTGTQPTSASILELLPQELSKINPLLTGVTGQPREQTPVDLRGVLDDIPSPTTLNWEKLQSHLNTLTGTNTFSGHLGNQGYLNNNQHAAQNSQSGNYGSQTTFNQQLARTEPSVSSRTPPSPPPRTLPRGPYSSISSRFSPATHFQSSSPHNTDNSPILDTATLQRILKTASYLALSTPSSPASYPTLPPTTQPPVQYVRVSASSNYVRPGSNTPVNDRPNHSFSQVNKGQQSHANFVYDFNYFTQDATSTPYPTSTKPPPPHYHVNTSPSFPYHQVNTSPPPPYFQPNTSPPPPYFQTNTSPPSYFQVNTSPSSPYYQPNTPPHPYYQPNTSPSSPYYQPNTSPPPYYQPNTSPAQYFQVKDTSPSSPHYHIITTPTPTSSTYHAIKTKPLSLQVRPFGGSTIESPKYPTVPTTTTTTAYPIHSGFQQYNSYPQLSPDSFVSHLRPPPPSLPSSIPHYAVHPPYQSSVVKPPDINYLEVASSGQLPLQNPGVLESHSYRPSFSHYNSYDDSSFLTTTYKPTVTTTNPYLSSASSSSSVSPSDNVTADSFISMESVRGCLSDNPCSLGVAAFLALGISSAVTFPFLVPVFLGRRRRGLDLLTSLVSQSENFITDEGKLSTLLDNLPFLNSATSDTNSTLSSGTTNTSPLFTSDNITNTTNSAITSATSDTNSTLSSGTTNTSPLFTSDSITNSTNSAINSASNSSTDVYDTAFSFLSDLAKLDSTADLTRDPHRDVIRDRLEKLEQQLALMGRDRVMLLMQRSLRMLTGTRDSTTTTTTTTTTGSQDPNCTQESDDAYVLVKVWEVRDGQLKLVGTKRVPTSSITTSSSSSSSSISSLSSLSSSLSLPSSSSSSVSLPSSPILSLPSSISSLSSVPSPHSSFPSSSSSSSTSVSLPSLSNPSSSSSSTSVSSLSSLPSSPSSSSLSSVSSPSLPSSFSLASLSNPFASLPPLESLLASLQPASLSSVNTINVHSVLPLLPSNTQSLSEFLLQSLKEGEEEEEQEEQEVSDGGGDSDNIHHYSDDDDDISSSLQVSHILNSLPQPWQDQLLVPEKLNYLHLLNPSQQEQEQEKEKEEEEKPKPQSDGESDEAFVLAGTQLGGGPLSVINQGPSSPSSSSVESKPVVEGGTEDDDNLVLNNLQSFPFTNLSDYLSFLHRYGTTTTTAPPPPAAPAVAVVGPQSVQSLSNPTTSISQSLFTPSWTQQQQQQQHLHHPQSLLPLLTSQPIFSPSYFQALTPLPAPQNMIPQSDALQSTPELMPRPVPALQQSTPSLFNVPSSTNVSGSPSVLSQLHSNTIRPFQSDSLNQNIPSSGVSGSPSVSSQSPPSVAHSNTIRPFQSNRKPLPVKPLSYLPGLSHNNSAQLPTLSQFPGLSHSNSALLPPLSHIPGFSHGNSGLPLIATDTDVSPSPQQPAHVSSQGSVSRPPSLLQHDLTLLSRPTIDLFTQDMPFLTQVDVASQAGNGTRDTQHQQIKLHKNTTTTLTSNQGVVDKVNPSSIPGLPPYPTYSSHVPILPGHSYYPVKTSSPSPPSLSAFHLGAWGDIQQNTQPGYFHFDHSLTPVKTSDDHGQDQGVKDKNTTPPTFAKLTPSPSSKYSQEKFESSVGLAEQGIARPTYSAPTSATTTVTKPPFPHHASTLSIGSGWAGGIPLPVNQFVLQPSPRPDLLNSHPNANLSKESFGGVGNPGLLGVPVNLPHSSHAFAAPSVKDPPSPHNSQVFGGIGNNVLQGYPLTIGGSFDDQNQEGFVALHTHKPLLGNDVPLFGSSEEVSADVWEKLIKLDSFKNLFGGVDTSNPYFPQVVQALVVRSLLSSNPHLLSSNPQLLSSMGLDDPQQFRHNSPSPVFNQNLTPGSNTLLGVSNTLLGSSSTNGTPEQDTGTSTPSLQALLDYLGTSLASHYPSPPVPSATASITSSPLQQTSPTSASPPVNPKVVSKSEDGGIKWCLNNNWCTLGLALTVAAGATGVMAVPLVVPVFGRRRRRRDASGGDYPDATLHLITSFDPDINLYEALVPQPTTTTTTTTTTTATPLLPTVPPVPNLDEIMKNYHLLLANLRNYSQYNNLPGFSTTGNDYEYSQSGDKYDFRGMNDYDDEYYQVDYEYSEDSEDESLPPSTTTTTTTTTTTSSSISTSTEAMEGDTSHVDNVDFMFPSHMSPLALIEGVPESDTFSAVPGLNIRDDTPTSPTQKPKPTRLFGNNNNKRRPTKGGLRRSCLNSDGCSLSVVLAIAGLAVSPLLVGRRRRRELTQGVVMGQHILQALQDFNYNYNTTTPEDYNYDTTTPEDYNYDTTTPEDYNYDTTTSDDLNHNTTTPEDLNHNTTTSDNLNHNTTTSDDLYHNTTTSDSLNHNTTTSDDLYHNTTTSDNLNHNTTTSDDLYHNTTTSDSLNHNTTTSDDLNHNSTTSDNLNPNTTTTDNLNHNTTTSDDLNHNTTTSDDLNHNTTTSDNLNHNTTTSDDLNHNTTTSDDFHNNNNNTTPQDFHSTTHNTTSSTSTTEVGVVNII
ncbi:hypothetical protein Pcinc_035084 [Petrolisthes cinctipes]|uniref:Uncharacterized protein n=1 Tax=Petrolisthes cinctipes TaxID=88211 RepID=A0AAE1EPK2_PETCI|nr:hypothetical protein Pcinc_035084 [Petrolisthes cinctipes]